MLGEETSSGVTVPIMEGMVQDAMPCHLSSEDMSLVLYKPVNKPALLGLSIANPSIIVSSDLIRSLKSKLIMPKLYYIWINLLLHLYYLNTAVLHIVQFRICYGYQML
jgi:hypothetical protein